MDLAVLATSAEAQGILGMRIAFVVTESALKNGVNCPLLSFLAVRLLVWNAALGG